MPICLPASPRIRFLMAAAVAGPLALGGLAASGALAQSLAGFNSSAPVDYAADSIVLQDKAGRVVLEGNVEITQGDLKLRAARTTVS